MRPLHILLIATALCGIAILELFSISVDVAVKQLVMTGVSLVLFGLIFRFVPQRWAYFSAETLALLSLVALVAVLFLPGQGGTHRWASLGGITFQPSELAKVAFALLCAKLLEGGAQKTSLLLKCLGVTALFAGLVFIEPDLATSLSFVFAFGVLAVSAGSKLKQILPPAACALSVVASFNVWAFAGLTAAVLGLTRLARAGVGYTLAMLSLVAVIGLATPILWNSVLEPYQRERIVSFLSPSHGEESAAWQVRQSEIALGSGGLFGKGFKGGTQKGLSFLPAAHTDFIFASIGEEFGFAGGLVVLLLFGGFLWGITALAACTENPFTRNLGFITAGFFAYHIFLNLASVVGLLPVAGIPLPFMSAGGSHTLFEFVLLGLFLGGVREERQHRRERV